MGGGDGTSIACDAAAIVGEDGRASTGRRTNAMPADCAGGVMLARVLGRNAAARIRRSVTGTTMVIDTDVGIDSPYPIVRPDVVPG